MFDANSCRERPFDEQKSREWSHFGSVLCLAYNYVVCNLASMPFALLLALAAIATGTLLTYLYDRDAPLLARMCAGACVGLTVLGLVGFIVASVFGLTPLALVVSGTLVAAPLALLGQKERRESVRSDIRATSRDLRRALVIGDASATATLIFFVCVALILWLVFGRAMYETAAGIFTGVDNNIGDLPFHLGVITGFTRGENFPPQHPEFAGARLTYPFLVDFVTAMFVRAGATLEGAMFWQNFVLALALVGLLYRWALKLTGDGAAALMTPVLVLLSGGFGWWLLLSESSAYRSGLVGLLQELPHNYTMTPDNLYRWGNLLKVLLVPQRGLLLGIPLSIIVWTLWWQATDEGEERKLDTEKRQGAERKRKTASAKRRAKTEESGDASAGAKTDATARETSRQESSRWARRQMLAAGAVAGLLPLAHAHSFVVMMGMGACLVLLFHKWWRAWIAFFAGALLIAVPQMLWATYGSAVHAGSFFGLALGWDRPASDEGWVWWFWLRNTGLFIPALIAALLWRGRAPVVSRRLLFFFLPFTLCFIVPNLYKLSPWVWDNIKVLIYWYIASVPLVALLLARLWRKRGALRFAAPVLLLAMTLAGGLDVWRVVSDAATQRIFDRDGVAFADMVARETPPRAVILNAPTYNPPTLLSGRRSFLGYPGHLWTHGLEYQPREAIVQRIYAGAAGAAELLAREGIEYVVVGPLERDEMASRGKQVNESFFTQFKKVGEVGDYRLYKTTRP